MPKHRASNRRPYPIKWELRAIRNRWWYWWKPTIRKAIRIRGQK